MFLLFIFGGLLLYHCLGLLGGLYPNNDLPNRPMVDLALLGVGMLVLDPVPLEVAVLMTMPRAMMIHRASIGAVNPIGVVIILAWMVCMNVAPRQY